VADDANLRRGRERKERTVRREKSSYAGKTQEMVQYLDEGGRCIDCGLATTQGEEARGSNERMWRREDVGDCDATCVCCNGNC
jgi:hypothetical protein